jgi:hypothetical protein
MFGKVDVFNSTEGVKSMDVRANAYFQIVAKTPVNEIIFNLVAKTILSEMNYANAVILASNAL